MFNIYSSRDPRKIFPFPSPPFIAETLSQMPLNQTLLRADICDNVSDIRGPIQRRESYLHVTESIWSRQWLYPALTTRCSRRRANHLQSSSSVMRGAAELRR